MKSKFPIPDRRTDYLGALVKASRGDPNVVLRADDQVYDDVSYRPATSYTFTGLLSHGHLPMPDQGHDDDTISPVDVPVIHVLSPPSPALETPSQALPDTIRTDLLDYLSAIFDPPDSIAAELLLLSLLASPISRPTALQPLGTFALNLIRPAFALTLQQTVSSVVPAVVPLDLTIKLLHDTAFNPSSPDSASLNAGHLQLAPGTVLLVDEDGMQNGGALNEKATKNLKALTEATQDQTVRYEYPYMEGLKMGCNLKVIAVSEGKALLPVSTICPLRVLQRELSLRRRPMCTSPSLSPPLHHPLTPPTCPSFAHSLPSEVLHPTASNSPSRIQPPRGSKTTL